MSDPLTRQLSRLAAVAVLAAVVLGAVPGRCRAQISSREFDSLPEPDKRTVLTSALEEWGRAVRNLQASSVTRVYNVPYRDGKAGLAQQDISRYACEIRRNDGNHWASIDWFLAERPDHPNQKVVTTLDAKSGVARSVAEQETVKGVYGAVATEGDLLIRAGRFHYWFDASFDKPREFPISFLLKHREAVKFEGLGGDGKEIQISLHVETNNGTPFQDSRTVWIDPQRGFMPVRMHRRWQYDTQPPLYSVIDTEVRKMEQVDGVWFPTHFTETIIGRLSVAEGYATVYETTVGPIKLGTMTDQELQVRFANGVQVQDRIKGVWFVANETTQSADDLPPPSSAPARQSVGNWWLIALNLLAILILATIFLWRRRRNKQQEPHGT